jgi:hypothetical protein
MKNMTDDYGIWRLDHGKTMTEAETKNSLLSVDINSGFLALVGNIKSYTGGVLLNKKLVS